MDSLSAWLQEVSDDHHFQLFMKMVADKRDIAHKKALSSGDTEFYKGRHHALKWMCDLPETIIKQSTDT